MRSGGQTNPIQAQAVRWAVEQTYGELTPQREADLEAWLAEDVRHRGAFTQACAWVRYVENIVLDDPRPNTSKLHGEFKQDQLSHIPKANHSPCRLNFASCLGSPIRNRIVAAATLTASAMALVALVVTGYMPHALFEYPLVKAPKEVVALADGSLATLSTDARIQVILTNDMRRINLLNGEVTFEVAKDTTRPFVVQTGDVFAQATGTTYSVRRNRQNGGTVRVDEGSVLVWAHDERDQAVLLHAGGMIQLTPGSPPNKSLAPVVANSTQNPPKVAQISLADVPIKVAVARFNRLNNAKIIIASPEIENIEIIGLYDSNDPLNFAHAVANITGSEVHRQGDVIVIRMK